MKAIATMGVVCGMVLGIHSVNAADPSTYLPGTSGARITQVYRGWPASQAGLESGDIIVSVNGLAILQPDDLNEALARSYGRVRVVVINCRNGRLTPVWVRPATDRFGNKRLGIEAETVDIGPSPSYGMAPEPLN